LFAGRTGFRTSDFRGRLTVINFFASWCIPCRDEHPLLSRIPAIGIKLIGINYRDQPDDARAWLTELGNPYKTVVVDAHGRTGIDFGVYGVPETYLVDAQGVIRFKQIGPLTQEVIDRQLEPLAEKLSK
jgi:DsbE subfamily thiol:disulfide oxidoreductase